MLLLAIDIGNSSINIGFFSQSHLVVKRIEISAVRKDDEYQPLVERFLKENHVEKTAAGVIICSVVPDRTRVLKEALKRLVPVEPLIVNHTMNTGLTFAVPHPEELGSDRIADCVAAYEYSRGPVAVADFGTASTISIVGGNADYIGGAILPGIRLMSEALARETAQLPTVTPISPDSALGTNTVQCIQSGLFYGTAGAVERLIGEIEKETGFEFRFIVTGGFGDMISSFLRREHTLRLHLTLEGLKILYLRNINA
ncbi:MAG: type III pantothenate kinase [Nitrospirota bacterium]